MICTKCQNILKKIMEVNKVYYQCTICGSQFDTVGIDTLINESNKRKYQIAKNGHNIFHYPANQKVFKKCESDKKCNAEIVAFEMDEIDMSIVYGCDCGYSWKEIRQVDTSK